MKYAIIDIGSSIMKYKLYEVTDNNVEPIIINDETAGIISYRQNDILTREGIDILINILNKFKNYSQKLNVDYSYYFATASLRNLKNAQEVLKIVKEKLDISITILTGHEEAEYSFNSIYTLDIPEDEGILIDIGGGSSEITLFKDKIVEIQESIPTGVLKIYYDYVSLIYPTKDEQKVIIDDTLDKIRQFNIKGFKKDYLYGIGRTFVIIKRLLEHMNIKKDSSNVIDISLVDIILNKLSHNSKMYYKPLLQVDSERIHTVIPSLLIVKSLAIEFNIKKIYVCDTTLQDGILYKLLNK